MRIALPDLVSPSYFPAIAAVELGFMEREGLDAQLELLFPVTKTLEALKAGELDFVAGSAHTPPMVFPGWEGAKLLMALAQRTYWFLVVRSDLKAPKGDISAVKGLRIGAAPGVDLALRQLLVEAGIDIERDQVQIGPVPGTEGKKVSFGLSAARAMEEGQMDGFWANGMGAAVVEKKGLGSVLLDVRRGDGPPEAGEYSFPALLTTQKIIEQQPEMVQAAMRAVRKTQKALQADPSLATEAARGRFPAQETEMIAELIARDAPFYQASISEKTIDSMNRFSQAIGILSEPVAYQEIVDLQFSHLWEL